MELLSYMRLFVEVARTKSFRGAAEAMLKVCDAPANLCDAVTGIGQRHDDVVVDLRHG